jgi:cellulose synthase/poly-beta-1,6-N-acetylglucosamine synthase-like glycosyltransferase
MLAPTPILSPARAAVALAVSLTVVLGALELAVRSVTGASMVTSVDDALLRLALVFVGYDLALGVVLISVLVARFRRPVEAPPARLPHATVLVAAWNEVDCLEDTVRRWAAQRGAEFDLLVGDDGSTDASVAQLVASLHLVPTAADVFAGSCDGVTVQLHRLPHRGKGATLNALALHATGEVLVTVDADTTPAPGALAALCAAFASPLVDSATGVVTVRNGRGGWLLGSQSAEYLKNAWVRIAWSSLHALDQVPGAFAALRASSFHAAGGFPTDSLTEDYEMTFRLMALGVTRGRPPVVLTVPEAQVFTDAPATWAGFIRQRTRWFAGFLSTLFRYRRLIFLPAAGAYGLVRLPLKVIDAMLPVLAFSSLVVLVRGGLVAVLGLSTVSLFLFGVRWVWDLFVYACATLAAPRLGSRELSRAAAPAPWLGWLFTAMEALTYVWLKHAAALRGTVWAVRRVRTWEASREAPSEALVREVEQQQP